jgi:ferredoxin
MAYTVTVKPQGVDITASEDESLLDALENADIDIEGSCGGIGSCGECLVHVLEGATSEPTLEEEDFLSEEMLEGGDRLACQTYPLSDLVIRIPE